MSQFDVVIIGAGVNGLATAAYLAKTGKRVLVLERNEQVGGIATVFADARWLPPQIAAELDLARHGFAASNGDARVRTPMEKGGWLTLHPDIDGTVQSLQAHSANDALRWPAFVQRIAGLAGFLEILYGTSPLRPQPRSGADLFALMRVGRRLRGLGKTEMIELLRTLPMSVAELLDDTFETDALKGTVGAAGIRGLMQGPRGGGTAFLLVHHQVGRPAGAFRGGLHGSSLVDALVAAAHAHGVEIRTGANVTRIRIDNGIATGVVLSDDTEVGAHIVVSSADPRHTLIDLVDPIHLDPDLIHAVNNIKFRGVVARVDLTLSEAPHCDGVAIDQDVISISPSLDYLERAFDDVKYGRMSTRPFIEARVSRTGNTYVLSAHVQYVPYKLREGSWDAGNRDTLGDRVVSVLDEHMPNLRQSIVKRDVITPFDLEARFGLTEGSIDHGELTLDQILFMRPIAGMAEYRTSIPSLFLCGAGTHPGGGIAGGAGRLAARAILE